MRQTFRQEEAEQILTEAVRRVADQETTAITNPEVTGEKLLAMAEELGVPPETLEAILRERETAVVREQEQIAVTQTRADFVRHRRGEFLGDLWSYLSANAMLTAIWFLTSPHGEFWPKWTLIWWGVFVLWHGLSTVPTAGAEFEKDFAKWQSRRERKAAKQAAKATRLSGSDDESV